MPGVYEERVHHDAYTGRTSEQVVGALLDQVLEAGAIEISGAALQDDLSEQPRQNLRRRSDRIVARSGRARAGAQRASALIQIVD